MASDPEIKDGFNLPVWMKNKPAKDFEAFAGSPPAPEDSFFYIRYPKTDVLLGKSKLEQDLPKLLTEIPKEVTAATAIASSAKDKDWSKHTKPCQDVLHSIAPINTSVNSVSSKPKPAGVDDGFKGEGAACGNSVVKVAHQMVSGRSGRGFTVASPEDDPAEHYNFNVRRGSKSLPVTPAHSPNASPTSRRKMTGNRYFTSPFEPVEDASSRSWLTMALLGFKKDLTTSTSTLAEEDAVETRLQVGTLAESVESLGPAPRDKARQADQAPRPPAPSRPAQAFRPKPSELREMNFWSPTSM
ncbi:uncharacterized protein LOC114359666 isoform X1 [Ostrinia furnacalis]|uniref:uncharacterized protein LOC114359666 isoform X1 n=1 Tax=Ostrinia furnacalis TaxID=93504 RepID=UPI001038AE9F|nr:uncharacterized protein LOC114359666 isoform X1 [Ostrinia furnacalis]